MEHIYSRGKAFVDEHGRTRIFNGINTGSKNRYPALSQYDIYGAPSDLKSKGINLVRYGVNWAALEKEPGIYDEAELERTKAFLDECEKNGIYVFLDIHQDLFANLGRKAKGHDSGDGAPLWAAMNDNHKFPFPYFVWAQGYFMDKGVHSCFDHFWRNDQVFGKGLLDRFADLWTELAKRFGDHPALFGYDLLNEPFPGSDGGKVFRSLIENAVKTTLSSDIDKKELLKALTKKEPIGKILPHYNSDIINKITAPATKYIEFFDKTYYMPFADKMTSAIRSVTKNGIILTENCYYSNIGIPFNGRRVLCDGNDEQNQAFAPHAYDLMVDTAMYKYADNERVKSIFERRRYEQDNNLNMPVVVGEWGGYTSGTDWLHHIEYLLDLFDSYQWSQTYYAYSRFVLNTPLMNILFRPYPIAVTGKIISYHHNRDDNSFTLKYNQDKKYTAPTEIFAHRKIKSIDTDGEYRVEQKDNDTSIIKINTDIGIHTVKIDFDGIGFSYQNS